MFIFKLIVGVFLNGAVFAGLLFLPAPTWDWRRAWIFTGVVLLASAVSTGVLYRGNRGLLEERLKPALQKGQPLADKIILMMFLPAFLGFIMFIPLDVFRLHLLPKPGEFVSYLGLALFITAWAMITLVMRQNRFAAPVVKHQIEREHTVIDTGLYRIVRHPMYASLMPLLVGMSLWLESYAAALLSIVPLAIIAVRIVFEERFLQRELPGYDAYTRRVRYRLIPFVW